MISPVVQIVKAPCADGDTVASSAKNRENTIHLALLNVRSLAGKSFLINDLIIEQQVDFMFLTETWLDTNNSAAVLIETAPPNYSFMSEVRAEKKGGGVASLYTDVLNCKQISFGTFTTFEYLAIILKSSSRVLLITIYRPPRYSANFLDEFTQLLSIICIDFISLIIAGDVIIHVDNTNDKNARELLHTVENFGLTQHVSGPTHSKGHTLDLLMSKGLDIWKVFVSDVALSDHYCISFEMSVTDVIHTRSDVTLRRYINENTCTSFIQAFLATPALTPNPVSNLVDTFNAKLTNIIDAIASLHHGEIHHQ